MKQKTKLRRLHKNIDETFTMQGQMKPTSWCKIPIKEIMGKRGIKS